jgi:hypothetical protein
VNKSKKSPTAPNPIHGRHYTTEKETKAVYVSKEKERDRSEEKKGTREPADCAKEKYNNPQVSRTFTKDMV